MIGKNLSEQFISFDCPTIANTSSIVGQWDAGFIENILK